MGLIVSSLISLFNDDYRNPIKEYFLDFTNIISVDRSQVIFETNNENDDSFVTLTYESDIAEKCYEILSEAKQSQNDEKFSIKIYYHKQTIVAIDEKNKYCKHSSAKVIPTSVGWILAD